MRTSLKTGENVLLIIRHHWLKLVVPFLVWLIIAALTLWIASATSKLSAGWAMLIILITAVYPLWKYFNWAYNIWVVTNLRVIDEAGYFSRHAKESPLDKINNIEYEQSFWGRIFGYGNVSIQTAAEMGDTNYVLIQYPKLLKDTITHAQEEYKKAQLGNQAQQLAKAIVESTAVRPSQTLIADELHKLFELLQKGAITQDEYLAQKNKLMGN